MTHQFWGPFNLVADCRLWLAEDRICVNATESEMRKVLEAAQLSDKDVERWNRYRPLEKKRQFLSSRIAVREVLNREFGTFTRDISLDAMASGKPTLRDHRGNSIACVSLSHTCNLTAVLISNKELGLGVDIEVVQPLNTRTFSLSFINEYEHQWVVNEAFDKHSSSMLAIWTLKEAFWKAIGGPELTDFTDITVEYQSGNLNASLVTTSGKKVSTATHYFGNLQAFPRELRNYSTLDVSGSQDNKFLGCVVVVGEEINATDVVQL